MDLSKKKKKKANIHPSFPCYNLLQQCHNSVRAKICQQVKSFDLDVTQDEGCSYKPSVCVKPDMSGSESRSVKKQLSKGQQINEVVNTV